MKNEFLCLIGCGWLGKPLAKHFLSEGHKVLATTASDQSAEFQDDALSYIRFDLTKDALKKEILEADILIYTIPPLEFPLIKAFFDQIPEDKKIIFTSSTSVYGKQMGVVDESTPLDSSNTQSPLLLETENYLRSRFKKVVILRLGGLYGKKRHPVYFLAGKKDLKTGGEFLHLAHQQDCISAIDAVVARDIQGETINVISDLRILKADYYTDMAMKLSLPAPEYTNFEKSLKETKISNKKSKDLLNLNYLNPSLFS